MGITFNDIMSRLNAKHINEAADDTVRQICGRGFSHVELTPGDMTKYPVVIIAPGPVWTASGVRSSREYLVILACSFGSSYPWMGHAMHADYCAQKWVHRDEMEGTQKWSGALMAMYLTAVAERLAVAA